MIIIFLLELKNNHKTVVIRNTNNDSVIPKNELRINLGANAINAVATIEIVCPKNLLERKYIGIIVRIENVTAIDL